ncbi:MAG: Mur ligase family protein [Candidatus Pacebacteria bacterium]|jgi:UDP-N-acetylmuramate: L-alanyl-gamma-D-glutamyl-meso-diaminopimelate ligase|nr:Mur ligase family protein [Candidatus Paceibacterota bacterium]
MQKVHLIGICGKAMAGLAVILRELGWEISGSDEGFYDPVYTYLKERGITFSEGYRKENIPSDVSLIVIGKHARLVPETNEEVAAAFASGAPVKSLPEVFHDLMEITDNIVVAGSFGKSTCTSLITWCLLNAGRDPSYMIGAVPFGFVTAAHHGKDPIFVIEGDEYPSSNWDQKSKFLYYRPKTVLLTSGEHDHLNVFPTLEEYLSPFKELVRGLAVDDLVVASKNGAHIREILSHTHARVVTYGLDASADWYAKDIMYGAETTFTLCHKDTTITTLSTSLLGAYNVENCVGCAALLLTKGILTPDEVANGIRTFQGVSGRLDQKPAKASPFIYEVYGSSQAKLKSSIEALKLHFPDRRMIAVFEPHTFSWRNRTALPWYEHIFDDMHAVFVFEPPTHGANANQLTLTEIVEKIRETHPLVYSIQSKEEGIAKVASILESEDIILLITSGDLGGMIPGILQLAEEKFPLS